MLTISLFDECLYAAELGLFENNEVDALWCWYIFQIWFLEKYFEISWHGQIHINYKISKIIESDI